MVLSVVIIRDVVPAMFVFAAEDVAASTSNHLRLELMATVTVRTIRLAVRLEVPPRVVRNVSGPRDCRDRTEWKQQLVCPMVHHRHPLTWREEWGWSPLI